MTVDDIPRTRAQAHRHEWKVALRNAVKRCEFSGTKLQHPGCTGAADVVHHLDDDTNNDLRSNVKVLCKRCHAQVHLVGKKRKKKPDGSSVYLKGISIHYVPGHGLTILQ